MKRVRETLGSTFSSSINPMGLTSTTLRAKRAGNDLMTLAANWCWPQSPEVGTLSISLAGGFTPLIYVIWIQLAGTESK